MTEKSKDIVYVKDISLGALITVLAVFMYYFAWAMTGYIVPWAFIVMLICTWFGRVMLRIGIMFLRGTHVDIS